MDIETMQQRAISVRERFAAFEAATYGREWTTQDLVLGLMTDIGDLAAAIQRVEGLRPRQSKDPIAELQHELSDCLWVLFVLAHRYGIDVAAAFDETMTAIERWIEDGPSVE